MPQRYRTRAHGAPCILCGHAASVESSATARAQEAITIDVDPTCGGDCLGQTTCQIGAARHWRHPPARWSEKETNGASRDRHRRRTRPVLGDRHRRDVAHHVYATNSAKSPALQVLFLYNGPEFDDRAEVVRITANGAAYTLAVGSANATMPRCNLEWLGQRRKLWHHDLGWGHGLLPDLGPVPFHPVKRDRADRAARAQNPFAGGGGTNDSDFALGFVEVAGGLVPRSISTTAPVSKAVSSARVNGEVAATLNSVKPPRGPDGPSGVTVFRVHLPDCRYLPQVCVGSC